MRIVLIVLGIIAALAVAAAGWFAYTRTAPGSVATETSAPLSPSADANAPSPKALAEAKDKFDRAQKLALEYQPFYDRMKNLYPADYERFTQAEIFALAQNPLGLALPDNILLDAVDGLRKGRGVEAAKASPQAIDKVFEMQANVLTALSVQDARLCEHFLFGGDAPAFAEFSAQNRGLIGRMAEAGLSAIADGEANKINREPPQPEDFALLETRLGDAKLEKSEIAALLDGQMPEKPFDPARVCTIGKAYYGALATLPENSRYIIYATALQNMAQ